MNNIERIEKTLHDVIDYLISTSDEATKRQRLKDIRRDLIDEPAQPEGYQGLNKWYWCNDENIIFDDEANENEIAGYGIINGLWVKYFSVSIKQIKRKLTESEIKEAILKGCEQNGIVDGARVRCLSCKVDVYEAFMSSFHYLEKSNTAILLSGDGESLFKVFDNGKFAEVVKEEESDDKDYRVEMSKFIGYNDRGGATYEITFNKSLEHTLRFKDIADGLNKANSNDKELLKECALIIKSSMDNYVSYSSKALMNNLLTKLKKHLNHE